MPYKDTSSPAYKAFRERQALRRRGGSEKTCARCGETKHETEFLRKDGKLEDGRQRYRRSPHCHPCRTVVRRDTNRRLALKKYGLTVEQFEAMLAEQNGACAICGRKPNYQNRAYLCVDHCHTTGRVRGLLCVPCNALLGNAQESEVVLESAMRYLNTNRGTNETPGLSSDLSTDL